LALVASFSCASTLGIFQHSARVQLSIVCGFLENKCFQVLYSHKIKSQSFENRCVVENIIFGAKLTKSSIVFGRSVVFKLK
jgi:hypothetical protein